MVAVSIDGVLVAAERASISVWGRASTSCGLFLTRGPGGLAARLAELPAGAAIVMVEALSEQPEELSLAVVDWPLPRRDGRDHKTLAYLDHVIARELAGRAAPTKRSSSTPAATRSRVPPVTCSP